MGNARPISKGVIWGLTVLFAALSAIPFLIEGAGFVALTSFAPLFCLEQYCRRHGAKHLFLRYLAAFALFNIAATWWIWYVSPAGAAGAIAVNTLFMTLVFRIFTFLRSFCAKRCGAAEGRCRLLTVLPYLFFVCLWIAWEHLYFEIELSWPWLTLGNAMATSTRLVQWYEYTGVEGGTLWILVSSLLLFAAITLPRGSRGRKSFACLWIVAAALPATLSLVRFYSYEEKGSPVEAAFAQPNIDPFMKYGAIPQKTLDSRLIQLLDSVATPSTRYFITPETFTYGIDEEYPEMNGSFIRFSEFLQRHSGASLLLGSLTEVNYPSAGRPTAYNSAILIDGNGVRGISHKSKLVPGVEIIPYQSHFPFLGELFDHFGGSSDSYGRSLRMEPLQGSDGHTAAPMVCYESVYGDYTSRCVRDGADFLAVITNDGWWGDTPGYRQHFRFAKLRSIENRRDLVHVANNGISGFINQKGEATLATPYWIETAARGVIRTNNELTFFSCNGDIAGRVAGPAALALAVAALILSCFSGRRCARGKSAGAES